MIGKLGIAGLGLLGVVCAGGYLGMNWFVNKLLSDEGLCNYITGSQDKWKELEAATKAFKARSDAAMQKFNDSASDMSRVDCYFVKKKTGSIPTGKCSKFTSNSMEAVNKENQEIIYWNNVVGDVEKEAVDLTTKLVGALGFKMPTPKQKTNSQEN